MEDKNLNINISLTNFLKIFGFCLGVYSLYLILGVIIQIFVSLIFALALEPFVEWLKKKKIPHSVSVLLVIFTFVVTLFILASVALTPLINQIIALVQNFPLYVDSFFKIQGLDKYTEALVQQLSSGSTEIVAYILGAFSGFLNFFLVVVFTTYILIDFDNLRIVFVNLFDVKHKSKVQKAIKNTEMKLRDWLRGQVFLMLLIGIMTYFGLILLGLGEYALALAVIAGLLEAVPVIGPMIAAVPAAIIGFIVSPLMGVGVVVLYLLIQQLENNLIVPKVMQKAIGFNPIVTILAFMIGGQILGLIGAILSLPILIVATEFYKVYKS